MTELTEDETIEIKYLRGSIWTREEEIRKFKKRKTPPRKHISMLKWANDSDRDRIAEIKGGG